MRHVINATEIYMVYSVPTGQLVFSSRPVVRTVRYVLPLVNTSRQLGEYFVRAEFASSYDLHLHGEKTCQNRFLKYINRALFCIATSYAENRRKFYNNSATQNGVSACVYFQRQRRCFSVRDVRVTMQITSQFQYFT